jgi:hypothetical protein
VHSGDLKAVERAVGAVQPNNISVNNTLCRCILMTLDGLCKFDFPGCYQDATVARYLSSKRTSHV